MGTMLATQNGSGDLPSQEIAHAIAGTMEQLKAVRTFIKEEFTPGVDFGKIPGCGDKPTLFLPGAQKATMFFNCYPTYKIKQQDLGNGHVEIRVRCLLISRATREQVGEGVGSCSTMEAKYRFRKGDRRCPKCGASAIIRGKAEYGGGFICFAKKGGCGAKFGDNAKEITSQSEGQVENPDLFDVHNTVLKMGKKRAHVDASMTLGCLSELFTQDIEDTYGFDDVRDAARPYDGEVPDEPEAEEQPRSPKLPDNRSGHGKTGTYASTEQVIAFNKWLTRYVEKVNDRWQEIWIERLDEGREIPGKIDPLLHINRAKNHLLNWCIETKQIDPAIVPEDVKVGQKDQFIAIPYHRSDEDRAFMLAEMKRYVDEKRVNAETMIYREHPEMAPEGWEDIKAEVLDNAAENQSQDVPYVAPEEKKRRQTKKELAEKMRADIAKTMSAIDTKAAAEDQSQDDGWKDGRE